jgi:hypothetical protein
MSDMRRPIVVAVRSWKERRRIWKITKNTKGMKKARRAAA